MKEWNGTNSFSGETFYVFKLYTMKPLSQHAFYIRDNLNGITI